MNNTPTPRTDEIEGNLIEFCDNPIRFPKMTEHSRQLEKELAAVTEQRDRLADVLRMTPLDLHPADSQGLCLCSQCEFRFAAASALQSLNQPTP